MWDGGWRVGLPKLIKREAILRWAKATVFLSGVMDTKGALSYWTRFPKGPEGWEVQLHIKQAHIKHICSPRPAQRENLQTSMVLWTHLFVTFIFSGPGHFTRRQENKRELRPLGALPVRTRLAKTRWRGAISQRRLAADSSTEGACPSPRLSTLTTHRKARETQPASKGSPGGTRREGL